MKDLSLGFSFGESSRIMKTVVNLTTFLALNVAASLASAGPPVCDSGGPYEAAWAGQTTTFELDGTGSSDPDGDPLRYTWRTNCPGALFDDDSSPTPTLTVDTSDSCSISCSVSLTLDDVIPPAGCDCDPAERPTSGQISNAGECSYCIEGSTCCSNGTWQCNKADGSPSCEEVGVVCDRGCCDTEFLADCAGEPASCYEGSWWGSGFNPPETDPVCEQCESAVIVTDGTPPVITCPSDINIGCDESTAPSHTGVATATDECDSNLNISWSDVTTPGDCPNETTITRTWTATDAGGNSDSCVQIINTLDNVPPTLSCNAETQIAPPDVPISFIATATDNCDSGPTVEITDYDCFMFTAKGKMIDKKQSCVVNFANDTFTILDSGGVGDHITWTVHAGDNCGNVEQVICETVVVNPAKR